MMTKDSEIYFSWIHRMTPLQTEELFHLFLAAFLPDASKEHLSVYFEKRIFPRLEKPKLLNLAFEKSKMVGFALFEPWEENSYYLAEMAVLPEYQRRGIGKTLLFSIFEKDPKRKNLLLITREENRRAQTFYEKIGFQRSSFQHPDYPEGFIGYSLKKNDLKKDDTLK